MIGFYFIRRGNVLWQRTAIRVEFAPEGQAVEAFTVNKKRIRVIAKNRKAPCEL